MEGEEGAAEDEEGAAEDEGRVVGLYRLEGWGLGKLGLCWMPFGCSARRHGRIKGWVVFGIRHMRVCMHAVHCCWPPARPW